MNLHIFLVDIISVKIGIYPILVVKKVSNTATHAPKIPWKTVFLIIHKTQKVALRRTTFLHILFIFKHLFTWAVNGAWTRDPQLGKLVLYQLSYYRNSTNKERADTRTRTGDLRITNALLYQLSHIGIPYLSNAVAKVFIFFWYCKYLNTFLALQRN